MNKVILFLVFLIFTSCNNPNHEIFSSIVNKTKAHNSIHYKVNEFAYFSGGIDTIITASEAWVVKHKNDSLKGGYIWVDYNYRPHNIIYQNNDIYLTIPPKKMTVFYPNFNKSMIADVDWIDYFLETAHRIFRESFTRLKRNLKLEIISERI